MKKKTIEKMPLKVLYLEDSPQDMEITRELLINAGFDLKMDCTESEKEFVSFLRHGTYDIILSDFKLPGFDGFAALQWATEICPAVPFICISGTIGEEAAVELIKMGAVDYVIKDRLKRLPVAIKRALNEAMEKKLRQQAEAALRESEEIFKQFMEHSPVYVFFKDENIRAMRLSKNYETMLGKPLDELLGKNMEDLFPSTLAKNMVADDKRILNEGKEVVVEEELNGRHYTTIKFPIRIEEKQRYLAGYTIDITERKHKEEELRKERAFIKNITDTSPVGITRLDRDGNILFANQRAEQILGLSKNTIVGLGYNAPAFHITDFHGGDFPDEQLPFHQVKAHLKPVYDIQHAIKLPDRKRVILSINAVPLLDEHGRFDGMVASLEDITERKRAQEALRQSEEHYKMMFESAPLAINITRDTEIIYANPAYLQMFGLSSLDELKEYAPLELFAPEWRSQIVENIQRRAKGLPVPNSYEVECFRKDGTKFPIIMNLARMVFSDGPATVGFIMDITERKRAEESLRESEERFRASFDHAPVGISLTGIDGSFLKVNQALCTMVGYSPEELLVKRFHDITYSEDLILSEEMVSKSTLGQKAESHFEKRYVRKDGKVIWVEISSSLLRNAAKQPLYFIVQTVDITEHKRAEEALQKSEEMLRSIFLSSPDSITVTDVNGRIVLTNQVAADIHGYSSIEQMIGKDFYELVAEEERPHAEESMRQVLMYGILKDVPFTGSKGDGGMFAGELSVSVLKNSSGKPTGFVGITKDVSERKRVEEALQNKERYQRALLDNFPFAVWFKDTESRFLAVNQVFAKTFNIPAADELVGKTDYDIAERKIAEEYVAHDRVVMQSRQKSIVEQEIIGLEKGKWYETYKAPVVGNNDELLGTVGFLRDISERKRTEALLENERIMLRTLVDTLPYKIYIKDTESRFIICNKASAIRLGVSNPVEVIGKSDFDFLPHELAERFRADEQEVINSGKPLIDHEEPIDQISGTTRWNLVTKVPIRDKQGNITGIVGSGRDITEQKQVERTLRENEQFFRLLFSTLPDAIILFDPLSNVVPWEIIDCNEVACRMNGYTREELIGKSVDIVNAKITTPEEHEEYIKMLQNKGVAHYETVHRHRDGHSFPVEVATSLVTLGGRPLVLGIDRDITDRKRAEELQRESEIRYRSVLQSATDAIVTADHKGMIVGWNSGAERIFGYSYTEAAGLSLTSLMPVFHRDGHTNGMERVLAGGNHHMIGKTVELEGIRKDESVFPLELSLSTWEIKSGIFFTGIIRDITERKRAAEELVKLSSAVEQSDSSIVITNVKGEIEYVNPKFLDITGYSPQEIMNKNPRLLKSGYTSDEEYKNLWKTITSGQVWRGEFHNKKKNGELFWESAIISPVRDSGGNISHFIAVKEDITQQRALADQLRQMQRLEGLGTLAGGIAHDFNNILGIILAYTTSITRFKDDAKKLDTATEIITKAVQRGTTLVQQILTFARKTETKFGPVDVNDVVMEIMSMILETFPKFLSYTQKFEKGIPRINADRSQLHQALLNLCVNARDAMPKGGALNISTRLVSVASLRLLHPDASASSYICIEVSDTGEGMSEEIRKRIFEPFFTTKGIGKGTGMGLAVVFGVVQSHKGFIDVESVLEKGTIFKLYLPASQVAEPISDIVEETLEDISGGTETLLIIEDEEMLLTSLRMVLEEKGYTVLSAGDGLSALKIYQEKKNDIALVLTDFGLPNISGLQVCEKIKQTSPNEKIILATGYLDPEKKAEFLKTGVQHFLYKPYDLKKVLKEVRIVLDGK